MSGKLIPEFDGRRNIRDMFTRKPPLLKSQSTTAALVDTEPDSETPADPTKCLSKQSSQADVSGSNAPPEGTGTESATSANNKKRPFAETLTQKPLKRSKSGAAMLAPATATGKSQQSLKGFFKTASTTQGSPAAPSLSDSGQGRDATCSGLFLEPAIDLGASPSKSPLQKNDARSFDSTGSASGPATKPSDPISTPASQASSSKSDMSPRDADTVHDPVQSKESWSKLFTKPAAPRCEGHDEPCKTMLTKKNGMNRGRSFWMCARPLGPSGDKEKNTQWRCHTFIWCSDWNPTTMT